MNSHFYDSLDHKQKGNGLLYGNSSKKLSFVLFFSFFSLFVFPLNVSPVTRPIVILKSSDIDAYQKATRGVMDALKNHPALVYNLNGDLNRIPHVMEKIDVVPPKAIIAIGSLSVLALKTVAIDAPVVFCMVVNPTEALQNPKSYAISMHLPVDEAYHRIKQVFPDGRIGIPYNPDRTGDLIQNALSYFKDTSIELLPFVVRSPSDLGPNVTRLRSKMDALWLFPDSSFLDGVTVKFLLKYSFSENLPLIAYSEGFSKSGALLSLVGNYEEMGRKAAHVALRVVAGDYLPKVQHSTKLQTYINLQVAKRMDILVKNSLIALADQVYP
ncbi:MAG TPA: ABC transporter substrate binding protein [Nitrospiria bacterium]|jgi:putative ABC transport system substrate-binding protein